MKQKYLLINKWQSLYGMKDFYDFGLSSCNFSSKAKLIEWFLEVIMNLLFYLLVSKLKIRLGTKGVYNSWISQLHYFFFKVIINGTVNWYDSKSANEAIVLGMTR